MSYIFLREQENNDRKDVILILIPHKKREEKCNRAVELFLRGTLRHAAEVPLNANQDHDRTWATDLFVFS